MNKYKLSAKFFITLLAFLSNMGFSFAGDAHNSHESLMQHDHLPVITAIVPQSFPPFYYTDEEGNPYGMAIDVMKDIDHNAGYSTHYIVKNNWVDVFTAIENGEGIVIPNLGITEKRKKSYFFTEPYTKTEITVFTLAGNHIDTVSELTKLKVGVAKLNIGLKIAKQQKLSNVQTYDSIEVLIQALISKQVDAIIYPKLIFKTKALNLNVGHLIYDNEIILKTIHRGIAVSKKHPETFKKLNDALKYYLNTQDFKDTRFAWNKNKKNIFTNVELVIFNLMVLLVTIAILIFYWKRKTFSLFKDGNSNEKKPELIWLITLVSILIAATSIVTLSTLWIVYETSFNEQRLRLVDTVTSRARFIESIARYDLNESKMNSHPISEASNRTLSQVISAHKKFQGFGKTGEFTLAKRNKENIEFILRQRHSHSIIPKTVHFNSGDAAPMRLALLGHSGTLVGKDYRGEKVLAAYEPVRILNLGIVAKIDITEIREPFIRSALFVLTIAIVTSLLGALLFFYIIIPVIKRVKETEQRFHQLFLNNFMPILLVDASSARIVEANKAAIKYYGYNVDEIKSYNLNVLTPNPTTHILSKLHQVQNNKDKSLITQHRLQNGEIRDVEILMSPIEFKNESLVYCVVLDLTKKLKNIKEHQQLEKELEQARKMEALGQLTGGIAHDFNNMLGIIMGYSELSLEISKNNNNDKIPGYLEKVLTASNNAKELIASMMLFSRTDQDEAQVMNISPLVKENVKMLRSILPTSINIDTNIDTGLPDISIEPVKLQQLIMNLCVNARDAMDGQGSLTVSLSLKNDIHKTCLISYEKFEGDWVELSVSDSGSGMSPEVILHLFEPFFTTKEKGKGTGMGMAVVHGIVRSLKGHILIDSELNKGSTIRIFFKPENNNNITAKETERSILSHENNNERILVVDDEEGLSKMTRYTLNLYGYQAKSFSSSLQALDVFTQSPQDFDLIFSDQTMPDLTGLEMIKKMREVRKDIPAIIATGYSDSISDSIAKENNIVLLAKPLAKEDLLSSISASLKNKPI